MSLDKYPALRSLWIYPSVTEEAIHLPPSPDMVGEGRGGECGLGRWSSSAQEWISEGGGRRRWKGWILIPLYGRTKLCTPTSLVKLAYLPSAMINGTVGLPTPILMRIPQ